MVRPLPKLEPDDDHAAGSSSFHPLRRCLTYFFPPATSITIASRFVPFLVCLSLIPLVLFFALFSGWYIWKNVPVSWQVPIYLQYGSVLLFPSPGLAHSSCSNGPSPYAELSLPPLSTTQPYDVSLRLVLPASEANFALGNFMATMSLSTSSNKTLITISRPVRLFSSSIFVFSPYLLLVYCTSPKAVYFLVLHPPSSC